MVPVLAMVLAACDRGQDRETAEPASASDEVTGQVVLSEAERDWLKDHPRIRFGYADSFEPDVILSPDGTYSGMVVDLMEVLNRKLGTDIGLEIHPLPELLERARTRQIDGIPNLHPDYAGQLGLLSTKTYWPAYTTVFAPRGASFKGPEDFAGKRVAIIEGVHFTDEFMRREGHGATILRVPTALEGLRVVERGDAEYFIGASYFTYLVSKYQLMGVVPARVFTDAPILFGLGMRADWPELVAIMDKAIAAVSRREINEIISRWSYLPKFPDVIALTPEEQAWLAEGHTVRVRMVHFPPFQMIGRDGPEGISVDYLKRIAEATGIRLEFVREHRSFSDAFESMKKLEGPDLIQCMGSEGREGQAAFSKGYFSSPRVIFVRTDEERILGIEDLRGRTVAVLKGTVVAKLLAERHPDLVLQLHATDAESLKATATGKADAYIGNLTLATYLIQALGLTNLKIAAPASLQDHVFSFACRRDWPELVGIVDKGMAAIPPGERAEIRGNYLSVRYEHESRVPNIAKWILAVLAGSAVLLLGVLAWNRQLARKVRVRTAELTDTNVALEAEVTERKRAEGLLRYQATLIENVSDAVVSHDMEMRIRSWNKAAERTYGWSADEAIGQPLMDVIPIEFEGISRDAALEEVLEKGSWEGEVVQTRRNGDRMFVQATVSLVRDEAGKAVGLVAVNRDVTERRKSERRLEKYRGRLRALASELTVAEERERRRLAGELHDTVAQSLAFARLRIAAAGKTLSDVHTKATLDEVSKSVRDALKDVRRVMHDLSSPSLDEIGIGAATAEWLEQLIAEHHGIETEFHDRCGKFPLDDNVRAVLFRNVRELVTNVVKHAGATKVIVCMDSDPGEFRITVEDDGVGFDPETVHGGPDAEAGFGLFSIREQMADQGGSLKIESRPGNGCSAILTIPLRQGAGG